MYNLVLSATPDYSPGYTQGPLYYNWNFIPDTGHEVTSYIGQANPAPLVVATTIKSYLAIFGIGTYSEYRVRTEVQWAGGVSDWFAMSGPIPDAALPGYLLSAVNLQVDTTYTFQNLNVLPAGNYRAFVRHRVYGLVGGVYTHIETITFELNLRRLGYNDIVTDPEELQMSRIIDGPPPNTKEFTVYANGAFAIICSPYLQISGGNIVENTVGDTANTYIGTDPQTLTITLDEDVDQEYVEGEPFYAEIFVTRDIPFAYDNTTVRIDFFEEEYFEAEPSSLIFTAIKNVVEPEPQILQIRGAGTFTANGPSWIGGDIPELLGEDSMQLSVVPINSINLSAGIYQGNIVINTSANDFVVPVTLKVVDGMDIGFTEGAFNFTKDRETISKFYGSNDNYVEMEGDVLAYQPGTLIPLSKDFLLQEGIFNFEAEFFIGELVNQIMQGIDNPSAVGFKFLNAGFPSGAVLKYYNASIVNVGVRFMSRFTEAQVGSQLNYRDVRFICGRKPSRCEGKQGIVDMVESATRVTNSSIAILNLFQAGSYRTIDIYRNEVFYKKVNTNLVQSQLFGLLINFLPFSPGDVIEARFYKTAKLTTQSYDSQKYIVFPEGDQSFHIAWENEHRLLSIMEFTGEFSFGNRYDYIESNVYESFLEIKKRHDTLRKVEFSANTGFILKADKDRIDSLLAARKAWILTPDGVSDIAIIPETKELLSEDSEQDVYEYTVNFSINLAHELENPTF